MSRTAEDALQILELQRDVVRFRHALMKIATLNVYDDGRREPLIRLAREALRDEDWGTE